MNVVFALRGLLLMLTVLLGIKGAALAGLLPDWPPAAQAATEVAAPAAAPQPMRVAARAANAQEVPAAADRRLAAAPARPAAPQPVAPAVTPGAPGGGSAETAPPPAAGSEDALAQALRARREQLDERDRMLAMREAVLAAAERRLQGRIDSLSGLQSRLEENERQMKNRDEAHWASLAKLYETMRPREAAMVFNELDLPLLAQIVNRMREQKAAPVFGAMEPERVRALTAELARMRAARPGL
ncbi:MotE family protein [Roseomonas sp. USHLN139]|uniref:MotE family protein n=1 Tax=Roseomonas sp. USHLN139 TaxID=3081298 RepID=UPI003B022A5A